MALRGANLEEVGVDVAGASVFEEGPGDVAYGPIDVYSLFAEGFEQVDWARACCILLLRSLPHV